MIGLDTRLKRDILATVVLLLVNLIVAQLRLR
jgi:hypothetical protein